MLEAFEPIDGSKLTTTKKQSKIASLMFLMKKHGRTIEDHTCVDGRKKRLYMIKEEAASPMVMLESFFLKVIIKVREGTDVATMDLPHKCIVMIVKRKLAEVMVLIVL